MLIVNTHNGPGCAWQEFRRRAQNVTAPSTAPENAPNKKFWLLFPV